MPFSWSEVWWFTVLFFPFFFLLLFVCVKCDEEKMVLLHRHVPMNVWSVWTLDKPSFVPPVEKPLQYHTPYLCPSRDNQKHLSCLEFRQILPLAQEWVPARVLFRHHRRECYKRVTRINILSNTCCLLYEFMNFLDRIKRETRMIRIAFNFQRWSWWKTCI